MQFIIAIRESFRRLQLKAGIKDSEDISDENLRVRIVSHYLRSITPSRDEPSGKAQEDNPDINDDQDDGASNPVE